MTRLPSLSSCKIIRALKNAGFEEAPDRAKGSHRAFVKEESEETVRLVIVPEGKDIPQPTQPVHQTGSSPEPHLLSFAKKAVAEKMGGVYRRLFMRAILHWRSIPSPSRLR